LGDDDVVSHRRAAETRNSGTSDTDRNTTDVSVGGNLSHFVGLQFFFQIIFAHLGDSVVFPSISAGGVVGNIRGKDGSILGFGCDKVMIDSEAPPPVAAKAAFTFFNSSLFIWTFLHRMMTGG